MAVIPSPRGIRARLDSVGAWLADPERRALLRVAIVMLVTRLAIAWVGQLTVQHYDPALHPRTELYFGDTAAVGAWLRWDVWWYISVVNRGYWFSPHTASNVAFLPLFPALIELFTPIFNNPVIAGLVVSNACAVGAVMALWTWVRDRASLKAAERAVLWLLVFPFSFFFHTVYAEGLFFLVCTLALRAADREHWIAAGIWAALATLTRPMGILLAPAFAWELLRSLRAGRGLRLDLAAAILLPCVTLGGYAIYLWARFGDPFVVLKAHEIGWSMKPRWNFFAYIREVYFLMQRRANLYMQVFDALQLLLPALLIALSIRAWRRLGPVVGVYTALAVAIVTIYGAESVGRETLAAVPLFAAAGLWDARPILVNLLRFALFGLLLVFVHAFALGKFLG